MSGQISVERIQYPVGHGGFHAGSIRPWHGRGVTYAYDCGADTKKHLTRAIHAYASAGDDLDVLFVSHLHSDHLSGIDQLTALSPPHTVVVPYLSDADLLLFLVRDAENGSLTSNAIAYAEDQERWWRERGTGTIIFLTGDDPDEEGDPPGPPEGGVPTEGAEGVEGDGLRLNAKIARPQRGVDFGAAPSGAALGPLDLTLDRGEAYRTVLGGTGSILQLAWVRQGYRPDALSWVLLPYVHDIGRSARRAFQVAAAAALGWQLPAPAAALLAAIKDRGCRTTLRHLYRQHFGADHNDVSMSLYSGPWPYPRHSDRHVHSDWRHGRAGWMKTGDAPFAKDRYRRPFLRFYQPFLRRVGVLNLPHHGSAHNFDEELIDKMQPCVALVTTDPDLQRVADVDGTRMRVQARGSSVKVVNADPASRYRIWVHR